MLVLLVEGIEPATLPLFSSPLTIQPTLYLQMKEFIKLNELTDQRRKISPPRVFPFTKSKGQFSNDTRLNQSLPPDSCIYYLLLPLTN